MAIKMGRPVKWESKEELQELIQKYFDETPIEKITITGLCLELGTNRQNLINYQNKPEFKETIERAKLYVEYSYELSLRKNGRSGDIFALKNFGWRDKFEVQSDVTLTDKRIRDLLDEDDLDNIEDEILDDKECPY